MSVPMDGSLPEPPQCDCRDCGVSWWIATLTPDIIDLLAGCADGTLPAATIIATLAAEGAADDGDPGPDDPAWLLEALDFLGHGTLAVHLRRALGLPRPRHRHP
ncbi:hypothetical protein [Gordonia paraffinivorans]|uniref:hypothetical protein n=1 Tax=Gordonia paraffinivorans TaxID=175628 RepID=UPI002431D8F4|nr:hypothetical protein [Gordonia paraffinivorans]